MKLEDLETPGVGGAMAGWYFVRTGVLGAVLRGYAPDSSYPLGRRVVVRDDGALRIGQVLAPCRPPAGVEEASVAIVRLATAEDELLAGRLERRQAEAVASCQAYLRERGVRACLLDAEYALDGSQLWFYFLGEAPDDNGNLLAELARRHGVAIELASFVRTLTEGCGPDCGSADAAGCRDGGCSVCSLAAACRPAGSDVLHRPG